MIQALLGAALTGAFGLAWGQPPTAVEPALTKAGYHRAGKAGAGQPLYEGPVAVGPLKFKRAALIPWFDPGARLTMVEARLLPEAGLTKTFTALEAYLRAEYDAPAEFGLYAVDAHRQRTGKPIAPPDADQRLQAGTLTAEGQVHLPGHGVLASGPGVLLRIYPGSRHLALYYCADFSLAEILLQLADR